MRYPLVIILAFIQLHGMKRVDVVSPSHHHPQFLPACYMIAAQRLLAQMPPLTIDEKQNLLDIIQAKLLTLTKSKPPINNIENLNLPEITKIYLHEYVCFIKQCAVSCHIGYTTPTRCKQSFDAAPIMQVLFTPKDNPLPTTELTWQGWSELCNLYYKDSNNSHETTVNTLQKALNSEEIAIHTGMLNALRPQKESQLIKKSTLGRLTGSMEKLLSKQPL